MAKPKSCMFLKQVKSLATTEQMLSMRIKEKNFEQARKELDEEDAPTNTRKRRATRRTETKRKKPKITAKDTIMLPGLHCSLGTRVLELGDEYDIKDAKSKYFAWLSKNGIIDIKSKSSQSQLPLIGTSVATKYLSRHHDTPCVRDKAQFPSVTKELKNVRTVKDAMKVLRTVETISPVNVRQRSTKNIYQKLLEQILLKPHTLTNSYLDQCSEQSLLIKIWSSVFEEFFGYQEDVFLQWGDTISSPCKALDLPMKLDLRIVANADESVFEAMTGEAAKTNATSMKKFYMDKLKTVLATKCHLNHFISSTSLTANEIKKVHIPIIQIMGTTCHISTLKLIDKGVYVLDHVARLQYPKTIKQLRSGVIEDLLSKLEIINDMIKDLQETRRSSIRDTADGMERISNDKRKQKPKQPASTCNDWFSDVLWTSDSDTEEDTHDNSDEEYSDLEEEAYDDGGSDNEFGSSEDIS